MAGQEFNILPFFILKEKNMRKGTKFINTDILKVMKGVVDSHVKYYQSDFDIDTELIKEAALKKERTDRGFIHERENT